MKKPFTPPEEFKPGRFQLWVESKYDHNGEPFRCRIGGYASKQAALDAAKADALHFKQPGPIEKMCGLTSTAKRQYRIFECAGWTEVSA